MSPPSLVILPLVQSEPHLTSAINMDGDYATSHERLGQKHRLGALEGPEYDLTPAITAGVCLHSGIESSY
jgi:hypothetical protein